MRYKSLILGTPIECIPPADFGGNHKTYVENFCWIHYTYSGKYTFLFNSFIVFFFLVDDKTALTRDFVRGANGSHKTPYYIWIPYIFIAAALCTYLPAWLWHVIGHRAAFDVPAMINQLSKMKLSNPEDRKSSLTIMSKHYEKVEQYSRSNNRITDSLFKKSMSACMFFAGGGVLTGK